MNDRTVHVRDMNDRASEWQNRMTELVNGKTVNDRTMNDRTVNDRTVNDRACAVKDARAVKEVIGAKGARVVSEKSDSSRAREQLSLHKCEKPAWPCISWPVCRREIQ